MISRVGFELPVLLIHMLLDNDLAGDKVFPELIICENPIGTEMSLIIIYKNVVVDLQIDYIFDQEIVTRNKAVELEDNKKLPANMKQYIARFCCG